MEKAKEDAAKQQVIVNQIISAGTSWLMISDDGPRLVNNILVSSVVQQGANSVVF
jgi:hypothetical protein